MKKRILSLLVLSALVIPTATTLAAPSAVKSFKQDLINANKQVINTAKTNAKANAASKADAKIAKYQKQIEAKQKELKNVKSDANLKASEKAKKAKAINKEIKELKAAIKELK